MGSRGAWVEGYAGSHREPRRPQEEGRIYGIGLPKDETLFAAESMGLGRLLPG